MDDMEGNSPQMTNGEKVRSVLPKFEDEFRNDNQIVKMLNGAISEALTEFYGEVIPEAAKLKELVAAKLDAANDREDRIFGGKRRSVSVVLPGWKLHKPFMGTGVTSSGETSEENVLYLAHLERKTDDLGTRDELRLSRHKPGYVLKLSKNREWKDNINRPTVIQNEVLSVWTGDPRDAQGKAKVNMGSESYPKTMAEIMPDVEKTVSLEAAQNFLETYEKMYGKVDLVKFAKKVEETGLGEVLRVTRAQTGGEEIKSGLVEIFFQTAVLYEDVLKGRGLNMTSGTEIMYGQGVSERDLRRPEGSFARIAVQVLERGEILSENSYKYSQNYFEPHLKKMVQN